MGISLEEFMAKSKMQLHYSLQPLTAIHLHSKAGIGEFESNGDIKYIYLFVTISLFILMLAIINFVNLSTARLSPGPRKWACVKSWDRSAWI